MPLYKTLVAITADTGLSADKFVLTPWFNDHGATTDPDNLAGQIADVFVGQSGSWCVASTEVLVTMYLHTPGDPTSGPPVGSALKYKGTVVASTIFPREVACCLSFYGGTNQPRKRGRLYLPMSISGLGYAVRPGGGTMTKALTMATKLSAVGGVDVDWVVHSKANDASYTVTNAWCDDEWDTQRRRGLRPTTRQLLSVSG
jgi:hypothetical protein